MINLILNRYPKKRLKLSLKLKKIHNLEYKLNRESKLVSFFEAWLHKSIKKIKKTKQKTLEIGAGTLNHVKYENLNKKNHIYDVIEPKNFLYKKSKLKKNINKFYSNLDKTPNFFYDRIISCATLEHLVDLPKFLAESSFKLNSKGFHSHSIPCEGCLSWNFVNRIIMGFLFKLRTGCNYNELMRHEHVNNFKEIYELIKFFYKHVKLIYSFPLYFNRHFSFYANITFSEPRYANCKKYLKMLRKKSFNSDNKLY